MIDYNNPNDPWMQTGYDPYRGLDEDGRMMMGCLHIGGIVLIMIIGLILCAIFSGCTTTKVVEVERVRTDTTYITKWEHDSIHVHDSIRIFERGDTVRIEKWHTKYIESIKHDTLYQSKTDSVPVPYPVDKFVEKSLSWWQRTQIYAGDVLIIVLLIFLGYGGFRLWRVYKFF